MKQINQPLHVFLREVRRRSGLKQIELAALSKVDFRRISSYEKGDRVPTLEHLAMMAPVLSTTMEQLLVHPTIWQGSSSRDNWFSPRHQYSPPCERYGHRRIGAAFALYGPKVHKLLARCSPSSQAFLSLAPSDSAPEWMAQLQHLAVGAEPSRSSALGIGFRQHFVIDPDTEECVGDCLVPSLIGEYCSTRYILLPQVHVRTGTKPFRYYALDFLCGVQQPGQSIRYVNIDIDGTGHTSQFDQERTRDLAMHNARFTSDEVGGDNFLELFHARIQRPDTLAIAS